MVPFEGRGEVSGKCYVTLLERKKREEHKKGAKQRVKKRGHKGHGGGIVEGQRIEAEKRVEAREE